MAKLKNRRSFWLTLTTAFVGLALVAGTVMADELLGVLIKVDVEGKKLTVVAKDTDKEIEVTTNDKTEVVTKKGSVPVDLEKLSKQVEKAKADGKKYAVKITHEKNVASKIERQKKAAN
jgi:biopolymer transport protein ExbD